MSRYLTSRPYWREEYIRDLDKAAARHPIDHGLLDASMQLSDRLAVLEAENALLQSQRPSAPPSITSVPTDFELQRDLAEAMRQKGVNETALRVATAEVDKLQTQTKKDAAQLKELQVEKAHHTTKLRDLEHELREKKRLLDTLQDEMLTLNLQLNMAEKDRDKVKKENKELIERFIQYKSQQEDAAHRVMEGLPERRRPTGDSSGGKSRR